MRILVDGLDMSGKTTLVAALIKTLEAREVPAVRHRGMLAEHHPVEPLLKRLPLVRQAESSAITAAFLVGGYALDGLLARLDPPLPAGAVIIQDGYADRTIAFGLAGGPYLAAVLSLWARRVFATFDVAVYLHAGPQVRRERMQMRADVDAADRRSVEDERFAARFNASLLHLVSRRHRTLLVFDTAEHTPEEIADQVLAATGMPALQATGPAYGRTA
ncbi:dTMP kinase [Streptomyces sp. TLI_053]|uniref:hypothetical protein n=1 Tax=Streptomyces sp. TLI_053 TaxID=1855352 RepID=UPI00087DED1D|nr:hypothetical protein [Streptomyces sp. TLI_053]SDS49262.1 dTMP kinase [Streptomyces sp. TLI_053]